ncbi:MAG: methylmalonyl Co-A mutase-associated GTPase MeaB [Bacteroidales bacterium]|nr:methylmalonyl Co-A mutase-associated GTPase MeaB [Bacteroidales bacterium]
MTSLNEKKNKSALHVNAGVDKPASVNPALEKNLEKFRKGKPSAEHLFKGIREGNRTALSQAITLVESTLPADQQMARELIQQCLPFSGNSFRLGITGVPGVGKSTFIEAFGLHLIEKGHRIAVLAIDPSSTRNKGSILGDKTRMEQLSTSADAFIRPSASAGTLGGVARKTRETMILCEAAGFDMIFVETVGVGQSETAVAEMVDFFLLLMLAGGGDELQGMKRGIMEMADLIVINKADGDNQKAAQKAKAEFKNALHFFPPLPNGWIPDVLTASALQSEGLNGIWEKIESFRKLTTDNGSFDQNRNHQSLQLFEDSIRQGISDHFYQHPHINKELKTLREKILNKELSPYEASVQLLNQYFKQTGI